MDLINYDFLGVPHLKKLPDGEITQRPILTVNDDPYLILILSEKLSSRVFPYYLVLPV